MPRLSCRDLLPTGIASLAVTFLLIWADQAKAQNDPYFSPTFAASAKGSPYSNVYARTFGSGAPAPATAPAPEAPGVVYVIEGGGLLTYRAEDYAKGSGEAVARTALPPADFALGASAPPLQLPSIADKFYDAPPLETGAGPAAGPAPIPLYPPPN